MGFFGLNPPVIKDQAGLAPKFFQGENLRFSPMTLASLAVPLSYKEGERGCKRASLINLVSAKMLNFTFLTMLIL